MTFYDYLMITLGVLCILVVLVFALRTKSFLKTLFSSALIGLLTLFLLHFTSSITGFTLELTPYTIGASSVFGLPGVICVVVTKMIFGL